MAIKIGITGGIGSGKTVVSRILEIMGVPVYISDVRAKELTITDRQIRTSLTALLGKDIYMGMELNKRMLSEYLFASKEHVQQINSIIHPCVRNDFRIWSNRRKDYDIIGLESAILFEADFRREVDYAVAVVAPMETRIERVLHRDRFSYEQVKARICQQMSDERRRDLADFVIVNDGRTALIPQVLQLISLLSQNNAYLCVSK